MRLCSGLICRGALGIACFGLSFGIAGVPSYAAQDGQHDQVTVDMVDASLSGSEQQAWRNLSADQKNATVRILNGSSVILGLWLIWRESTRSLMWLSRLRLRPMR